MEEDFVNNEAPNWSKLDIELSCPRCGYNLRMLELPRCPECGLHFQWDKLIRAKKEFQTRPPIFEYHWRSHPIRSFALTVWLCLQPWRLWRWLPLTAVPSVRVMPFLLMLVMAMLALIALGQEFIWYEYIKLYYRTFRGQTNFGGFRWFAWYHHAWHDVVTPSLMVFVIWCLIQVFRQTIARYRVRQRHIFRIVLFSWIGVVGWQFIGAFFLAMLTMPHMWAYRTSLPYPLIRFVNDIPLVILFLALGFGFHSYLHVRGAWLWALVLMVSTFVLIVIVGLIISLVIFDTLENQYWKSLAGDYQPFPLMRELASWAINCLR